MLKAHITLERTLDNGKVVIEDKFSVWVESVTTSTDSKPLYRAGSTGPIDYEIGTTNLVLKGQVIFKALKKPRKSKVVKVKTKKRK